MARRPDGRGGPRTPRRKKGGDPRPASGRLTFTRREPNVTEAIDILNKHIKRFIGKAVPETEAERMKLISVMARFGGTDSEICEFLLISHDQLKRKYKHTLVRARSGMKSTLRLMQWQAAERGNPAMLIWLGKQLLEQREPTLTIDWNTLSDEDLERIEAGKAPEGVKRGRQ